jgi:hypothetical protein
MAEEVGLLGEAHLHGPVILAWDNVMFGAKNDHDAHNVVMHELAHKIDFVDGDIDGTPPLETAAERHAWGVAFSTAFNAQKARADKNQKSFLRDYAITNEAEYFAVATETFFEKPKAMQRELPDVYAALADFYNLDLASR